MGLRAFCSLPADGSVARWLSVARGVLRAIPEGLLPNLHISLPAVGPPGRPGGEEAGVVCNCSGSGIGQNRVLCGLVRAKALLFLEPPLPHLQNGNCNRACPPGLGGS